MDSPNCVEMDVLSQDASKVSCRLSWMNPQRRQLYRRHRTWTIGLYDTAAEGSEKSGGGCPVASCGVSSRQHINRVFSGLTRRRRDEEEAEVGFCDFRA